MICRSDIECSTWNEFTAILEDYRSGKAVVGYEYNYEKRCGWILYAEKEENNDRQD